jgi:Transposase DDE domain
LPVANYAKAIVELIGFSGKMALNIDRTNWKFGKKKINYLVLSWRVSKNFSIPLFFIELDKDGNSSTKERIDIIELFVETFDIERIGSLGGDREFIGEKWVRYLMVRKIPFFVRVKENMLVDYDESKSNIREFFQHLKVGQSRKIEMEVYGQTLVFEGTRSQNGDLVIVLSNQIFLKLGAVLKQYRKRWSIEELFRKLKTSGFNWENTHMITPQYLEKLLVILGFATTCVFLMGTLLKIPWRKTVGYPLRSIFRQGFLNIQYLISQSVAQAIDELDELLSAAKFHFARFS